MERNVLILFVVGILIVIVGGGIGGWPGTIVVIAGAFGVCYAAYLTWKSRSQRS